jgi:hypothetical protein
MDLSRFSLLGAGSELGLIRRIGVQSVFYYICSVTLRMSSWYHHERIRSLGQVTTQTLLLV